MLKHAIMRPPRGKVRKKFAGALEEREQHCSQERTAQLRSSPLSGAAVTPGSDHSAASSFIEDAGYACDRGARSPTISPAELPARRVRRPPHHGSPTALSTLWRRRVVRRRHGGLGVIDDTFDAVIHRGIRGSHEHGFVVCVCLEV